MEYKLILGWISIVIAVIGYVPYFVDIFRGKTKPHAFSWLVWGLLTGIAFVAQVVDGGGYGAWVTGLTSVVTIAIFILALLKGTRDIKRFDWMALSVCFLGIAIWGITKEPLYSVILVTVVDAVAFVPTFRKSFMRPGEETVSLFFLSALKFIIGIIALEHYSVVTWLYPASLVLANGAFVLLLIVRRWQLRNIL